MLSDIIAITIIVIINNIINSTIVIVTIIISVISLELQIIIKLQRATLNYEFFNKQIVGVEMYLIFAIKVKQLF